MSQASEEAKPINVTLTGPEQIKQFKGKKAQLILKSGKEIEGTVSDVTSANIEVKSLAGKEFFDALVKVDEVAAIVYRVK